MTKSERLPSYRNPPVIEVVASVQFDPFPNASIVHLGLLWQRFRQQFPNVESQLPLAPVVERLGVRAPLNRAQIEVSTDVGAPRLWFVNESGDELIQIQQDRFIRNWRAMPKVGKAYPRYEQHIRPRFLEDYRVFQRFLHGERLGDLNVNQCEVTYVNHIYPNRLWSTHDDLGSIFRGWNAGYSAAVRTPSEAIHLRVAHILNDVAGEFLGRLHVTIQSAFRGPGDDSDKEQPIFVLTLTARGRPTARGEDGVVGFLDLGRRAIVESFDRMTTPEMHEVWGKCYES